MNKKNNKTRIIALITTIIIILGTIASPLAVAIFAADSNKEPAATEQPSNSDVTPSTTKPASSTKTPDSTKTPETSPDVTQSPTETPELTEEEVTKLEDIMKGLSTFKYKVYEWPNTLTVGGLSYSIAESIYTKRNSKSKKPVLWSNKELKESMQDYYSSTNWKQFTGMTETIQISNYCEAVLSDEVAEYESIMDSAADKYGFTLYKEIFKAIAQARFNTYKEDYELAKQKGKIHKIGDPDAKPGEDQFDLFHIDGSWIDGGKTPLDDKKAPTPSPLPTPTPVHIYTNASGTPIPPPPTPMPAADAERPSEKKNSIYTVAQSVEIAAKAFANILDDAVYPTPYDTNRLISVVQGFEFGGTSNAIKNRFISSGYKLSDITGFISFAEYFNQQTNALSKAESEGQEDIDYDKIIENYAQVIANGEARPASDVDTCGKYKYSDQLFYQKVFENYKCSGGGAVELGALPENMQEILKQCMKTWDSRVTKERRAIIQSAVNLYGVTYSMDSRNSPSVQNPQYLDCSSFTGQAYWRAGVLGQEAAWWTTGTFASKFQQIQENELIPGDIAQKVWNPGGSGGSEHIGIYIGTVNGTKYYIHCTSYDDASGQKYVTGKGVQVNSYSKFQYFGRCPQL